MSNRSIATFGAGCFWCVDAVYAGFKGVEKVVPGYCGGHVKNPSYKEVCEGDTGHVEVVMISFDADLISYVELLDLFWEIHNPTQVDGQGMDIGTQYRSVIFFHDDIQREIAEKSKRDMDESGRWLHRISTQILPATTFYPAEEYHRNYYQNHKYQGYCAMVITPKIEMVNKIFSKKIENK